MVTQVPDFVIAEEKGRKSLPVLKKMYEWAKDHPVTRGGPGSGFFGHEGRPGYVGGSTGLAGAVKSYSQVLYHGAVITSASAKLIAGESTDKMDPKIVEKAGKILNAIRSAPETNVPLYRSVQFVNDELDLLESQKVFKAQIEGLKVGDKFSLGRITSFSSDRHQAAFYGVADKAWTNYEFRIPGSSKSISTDEITGMGHMEWLTDGMFKVVDILPGDKVKVPSDYVGTVRYKNIIVLEQVGVY